MKKNSTHPLNRAQRAAKNKDFDTYSWCMLEAATQELKLRDELTIIDHSLMSRFVQEVSRRNPPVKDPAATQDELTSWLDSEDDTSTGDDEDAPAGEASTENTVIADEPV